MSADQSAENPPFDDGAFDAVVSTFGVMFTPNQRKSAEELIRVCKPGGKIGLANWTPNGFVGQMFKTLGRHVPPPAGVGSPAQWGDEDWIAGSFGDHASSGPASTPGFQYRRRNMFRSPRFDVEECWREAATLITNPLGCVIAFGLIALPLFFI